MARALLHGATQGVLAWVGGGYSLEAGLQGAGGAIFASVLAPLLTKEAQKLLSDSGLGGGRQTTEILANLIGELAVTGIGSLFHGPGGLIAASVTVNNYLTHKQMQELTDKIYEIGEKCQIRLFCAASNDAQIADVLKEYSDLSVQNDNTLIQLCASGSPNSCQAAINDLQTFVSQQQAFYRSFGASEFNLPQAIGFGDAALLNALNAFYNPNSLPKNGPVLQDPKAFALTYIYEYSKYVSQFNTTTAVIDGIAKAISVAPLAPELAAACSTFASVACASAISQGVVMGDAVGSDFMRAAFGGDALSPLTTALTLIPGVSKQDAVKTMFLINTGVVTVTLGQIGYQFASTGIANTAEEVAMLNKMMADRVPNMAVPVGGPRYVASDVPVPGTTVQLTKNVTLSDGTPIPAGSIVTQVENGYKIIAADGTTSTIVTQAVPGETLALLGPLVSAPRLSAPSYQVPEGYAATGIYTADGHPIFTSNNGQPVVANLDGSLPQIESGAPLIAGATVTDKRTGQTFQGTVDPQPTLDRIDAGVSFPSRNDGTTFRNAQGLLPTQPSGYYTEYVLPTPGVSGPGAQRIVTGTGGEAWYTPDHYATFIKVK